MIRIHPPHPEVGPTHFVLLVGVLVPWLGVRLLRPADIGILHGQAQRVERRPGHAHSRAHVQGDQLEERQQICIIRTGIQDKIR